MDTVSSAATALPTSPHKGSVRYILREGPGSSSSNSNNTGSPRSDSNNFATSSSLATSSTQAAPDSDEAAHQSFSNSREEPLLDRNCIDPRVNDTAYVYALCKRYIGLPMDDVPWNIVALVKCVVDEEDGIFRKDHEYAQAYVDIQDKRAREWKLRTSRS